MKCNIITNNTKDSWHCNVSCIYSKGVVLCNTDNCTYCVISPLYSYLAQSLFCHCFFNFILLPRANFKAYEMKFSMKLLTRFKLTQYFIPKWCYIILNWKNKGINVSFIHQIQCKNCQVWDRSKILLSCTWYQYCWCPSIWQLTSNQQ